MADEQTTDETTDETPDAPAGEREEEGAETTDAPAGDEPEEGEQDGSKAAREAARYRRRLREAEAQRDALAQQLEALQRQMVERIIQRECHGKPAGLWASGVTVADLIGEDGTVDPDKVKAAWENAVEMLGLNTRINDGAYVPSEGRNVEWRTSGTSWQEALRPL